MKLFLAFIILICVTGTVYAEEKTMTLNEYFDSVLKTNCSKFTKLESNKDYYNNKDAVKRCNYEINLIKAIQKDDLNEFNNLIKKNEYELDNVYNESFTIMDSEINVMPIHVTVVYNSQKIFKTLLNTYVKNGRRINTPITEREYGIFHYNGKDISTECVTPAALSIIYGNNYMFKEFTSTGIEYISIDKYDTCSTVDFLLKYGNKEMFKHYEEGFNLKNNYPISKSTYDDFLSDAVKNNNISIVEYLIKDKKMSVYTSSREMLLKTALTAKKPLIEMAEKLIELGFDVNYPFDIDRTYYDVIVELKNKGIWNKPLPAKKEYNQQDKNTANLLNKPQVVNGIRQVKSITEYKDYIDKKMLIEKIMNAEKERAEKYGYTSLVKQINKYYFEDPKVFPDIEIPRKAAIFTTNVSYGINDYEFYWSPAGNTIVFKPYMGAYYSKYRINFNSFNYIHEFGLYSNVITEHNNKIIMGYEYKDVTLNEAVCGEINYFTYNNEIQNEINKIIKDNNLCSNIKNASYNLKVKNIIDEFDLYTLKIEKSNNKAAITLIDEEDKKIYKKAIMEQNNKNVRVVYTGE